MAGGDGGSIPVKISGGQLRAFQVSHIGVNLFSSAHPSLLEAFPRSINSLAIVVRYPFLNGSRESPEVKNHRSLQTRLEMLSAKEV